ncbi:hypothetical protein EYF80_006361 [Liparis tanakae]|uniref:Uncharacterized protein n=1 Tax=Liparis tanakae TaxID=230148 RepID=A0A4Z2IZG7_9TELE|nr:hypothetical protein EYF80_006361 [Liparis tanakae]
MQHIRALAASHGPGSAASASESAAADSEPPGASSSTAGDSAASASSASSASLLPRRLGLRPPPWVRLVPDHTQPASNSLTSSLQSGSMRSAGFSPLSFSASVLAPIDSRNQEQMIKSFNESFSAVSLPKK